MNARRAMSVAVLALAACGPHRPAPIVYDAGATARLAGWVHEAHAAGRAWTLVLPDGRALGPSGDHAHYHRSMTALALLP